MLIDQYGNLKAERRTGLCSSVQLNQSVVRRERFESQAEIHKSSTGGISPQQVLELYGVFIIDPSLSLPCLLHTSGHTGRPLLTSHTSDPRHRNGHAIAHLG